MAEMVDGFSDGLGIDWQAIANGKIWRLSKGTDYTKREPLISAHAHSWAKANGFKAKVRTFPERGFMEVQFFSPGTFYG